MGNAQSTRTYITEEFQKANQGNPRDYLVLDQIMQVQPPRENPIDLQHIGALYIMDKRLCGRFYYEDLLDFGDLYCIQTAAARLYDAQSKFKAYCTLQMWSELCKPGGIEEFVAWFGRLLSENMTLQYFDEHPTVPFLPADTVKTMHSIMAIKKLYGMDFQEFFSLMQRVAEEQGIMKLEEEKLDEVVPLVVSRQFAREFINGFVKLMSELGFDKDMFGDFIMRNMQNYNNK